MKNRGELPLGFLVATVLWLGVVAWGTSYAPSDPQKDACYQAAAKSGRSTSECETFWEKTTSEPVAVFTLVLAFSTIGLWVATGGLYVAGKEAIRETRRIGEAQTRAYVSIKTAQIDFLLDISIPRVTFVASNSGQSPARNFVWNVTLQYAGPSISRETVFYEQWLTTTGMDIPAASDAHPEGALVPMPAKTYVEAVPGVLNSVIRLKIDFRYTDVFERDWFGEAYFAGIMHQRPIGTQVGSDGTPISPWIAKISPMPRPRD